MLKAPTFSKQPATTSSATSDSEEKCVIGGHSAGCRTSWVCLQHHATVVISNVFTICGSQFPPTVSKHCKHQHSAIPKPLAMWNTNNPSCCDIQGAASSVQHHRSLCSQQQRSLLWCIFMPANIQQKLYHKIQIYIQSHHFLHKPWHSCPKIPTTNTQVYFISQRLNPTSWKPYWTE